MVHKILLWSGFGIAVRFWQLGIEMRPFFHRNTAWVYPAYAGVGGAFGYWLTGVEQRQIAYLSEKRDALLEKRKRRAEREGVEGTALTPQEGRLSGMGETVEGSGSLNTAP